MTRGGGLEGASLPVRPLQATLTDPSLENADRLLQSRPKRVIGRLGKKIGPGGDQMSCNTEGRAGLKPALDDEPGLVDPERFA